MFSVENVVRLLHLVHSFKNVVPVESSSTLRGMMGGTCVTEGFSHSEQFNVKI